MNSFDVLRERGFVNQCTDEEALRRLLGEGPVTCYAGYDPTGPSLHVGHLVPTMALAWLARGGHKIVVVIGGGTSRVGDPTGKDATRELLDEARIDAYSAALGGQLQRLLGATPVDNATWLLKLGYIEFLRDIGVHFSVNRMIASEGARQRLERNQGLSFIEFNYSLLQSYDFLELHRRHDCRLQIGGGDQWFNIVSGVDLIRRLHGTEVFGLTLPLITTADGKKMGKTVGGAVWIDGELLPPYQYFQYWLNVDDRDVERFLRLFTFLDLGEIAEIARGDIRAAKHRLAVEATAVVHGMDAARAADEAARAAFSGGASADMPTFATTFPVTVVAALVGAKLAKSNSEARRLVEQGGVSLGEERVGDPAATVPGPTVLWAGKKRAVRLVEKAEG